MPDVALALAGVGRRYGEREALGGVTLDLPAGQTLGVFGPNGAGKTTLLRVLATLLRPHEGTARVLDSDLPGGAWRYSRTPGGYRATVVSGTPTWLDGKATGNRPGGMLAAHR